MVAGVMWLLSWLPPELPLSSMARILIGAGLAISGGMCVVLGVVAFRAEKTTVNPMTPDAASALVTSGIYGISRNPMYLGFLLLLLGWSLWLASLYALALSAGFVWYMNRFQIAPEETALGSIFGSQFTAYKKRVRRWL